MNLHGRHVLVMGLGVHGGGLGVARWLLRQGARVTVTDMADASALAAPLAQLDTIAADLGTSVRYTLGEHRASDFTTPELIVANPAVRPDSPWLALAHEAAVPIASEMSLFFERCPGPILGVTGTKGKTTTALLLAAMLRQEHPGTVAAGNMRVSALEALDKIDATTPVVLELSSFQLVGLGAAGYSPQYALITNISPDHLNYHGTMHEYVAAKAQIYLHQSDNGVTILPHDLADLPPPLGTCYRFGLDTSEPAGRMDGARGLFLGEELFTLDDMQLRGRHNLANALAAASLARSFGISAPSIRQALRSFGGVEHRQELVRILDGVRYINDTTATNPAAALAALESLPGPLILIAGGADKKLEFDAFARAIMAHTKAYLLLEGSGTARLAEALGRAETAHTTPLFGGTFGDFTAAIEAAQELAVPGDTVLLSPGCASFGMFQNEFHRGEEFRRIVNGLTAKV
ncbi:UDP-N-acetylmuramoyl-L-alanine--D-glutamate ligase [Candidatus Gracilibacteria bacterium]|nr:UDP-N-acetylmuramoyl-L-alanine--D-glutamate ligase [Candidatus Gracilibacteria bacterium]